MTAVFPKIKPTDEHIRYPPVAFSYKCQCFNLERYLWVPVQQWKYFIVESTDVFLFSNSHK